MSRRERRKPEEKQHKTASVGEALASFLAKSGLAPRVEQASVVPEWASLVGPQIAAVTQPLSVTQDGLLFVAVSTHGWMAELSMLEPELLRQLNAKPGRKPVTRIRWLLQR
ncbi:MAG: DciA family protein [Gemmatimonadaceae bacterium]